VAIRGEANPFWPIIGEANLFWGGVCCGVVEACRILALTLRLGEVRLTAGERASIRAEDFALGVGVTAPARLEDARGGVWAGVLMSFGEYMEVVLSLCEPARDLGGALFCLEGREGVVREGWTGTEDVRRIAGVLELPGVWRPDLTVLEAAEGARGFEEDIDGGWTPTCNSPS
jgi:hypothetical protein